jgi:hypothetical protein
MLVDRSGASYTRKLVANGPKHSVRMLAVPVLRAQKKFINNCVTDPIDNDHDPEFE